MGKSSLDLVLSRAPRTHAYACMEGPSHSNIVGNLSEGVVRENEPSIDERRLVAESIFGNTLYVPWISMTTNANSIEAF